MDAFDYAETQKAAPRRNISGLVWNILTILALLGLVLVGMVFLYLFINPFASINPFPPPTVFHTSTPLPTSTATIAGVLPPTWTPTPTLEPSATKTQRPTATPIPSDTPVSSASSAAGTATKIPGGMPFVIQQGSPSAISSQPFHPEAGCSWQGVTGYVFDLRGGQVNGQEVHLGGQLNGIIIPETVTLTGLLRRDYGTGYFEFTLGDHPVASKGTLWIQLVAQGGLPMSEKFTFDTYDICDKNMVIINFKQVR